MPSSSGMTMSSSTTSYESFWRASSASTPLTAEPTVWPCCSRLRVSNARLMLSSSTTSTCPRCASLGQCGVVGDLDESACQGLEHFRLDTGVLPDQLPEVLPRQDEEAQRCLCGNRRHPGRLLDQRDLAKELAAGPRGQMLAVLRDLGVAIDDHEELLADVALLAKRLSSRDLEVLADPGELPELLAREALEQRDALECIDLGVLAEQLHGPTLIRGVGRVQKCAAVL